MAATDTIKLNLRLPKGLHRRLVQQAKRNNVSLNTEIVNQLESHESHVVKQTVEVLQPTLQDLAKQTATAVVERFWRDEPHKGSSAAVVPPKSESGEEK